MLPSTMTRTPTLYQMWHVVLPLKGTPDAKSRLDLPRSTRDRMVHAMAADTLEALLAAAEVQKVSILSRRRDLSLPSTSAAEAEVIVQPRGLGSLDQALAWFASTHTDGSSGLAVVVADLPALRPASMTAVLTSAAHHRVAMVTDTEGSGTTVLTAGNAAELPPHFGEASAAAHRAAGAVYVRGTPDVQCDVDTVLDLARARVLGLGQHTLALLGELDLAGDAL